MRLDKFLAHAGYGSRRDVKKLIAGGAVTVNGKTVKQPKTNIDPDEDVVAYLNDPIHYQTYYYIMLNKPQGIVSATTDNLYETVIDWVALDYQHVDLFPVGRLDIDTTGLLLLTNNGQLAHQLTSPKKEVPKTYFATVTGQVDDSVVAAFEAGIDLTDFTTQPAQLTIDAYYPEMDTTDVTVTITEGKFHQVKRMFQSQDHEVLSLHRHQMGPLILDESLDLGGYRELTDSEWEALLPYGIE